MRTVEVLRDQPVVDVVRVHLRRHYPLHGVREDLLDMPVLDAERLLDAALSLREALWKRLQQERATRKVRQRQHEG